ncbi:ATP-dependent DNA helicase RecG [Tannockella kyphosi]|uniref:ATP-dependent DNA helicase RecG n=1 Tax=Tannockella kyphosi TaxID=2899121 RepID=UPI00201172E5|nr:ATP-dependent DNA helicase RecG [Tannockella kyphosi]
MDELKLLKIRQDKIDILHQMGIQTIEDLYLYYPYRYAILEATPLTQEKCTIEAILLEKPQTYFHSRVSRLFFTVLYEEQRIKVTLFNRHFLAKSMVEGMKITLTGKYDARKASLVASDIYLKPIDQCSAITPIYSLKEGINAKMLQSYIKKAMQYQMIEEDIPVSCVQKYRLLSKYEAIYKIHFPEVQEDIRQAIRYLKYREFFYFQLTMQYTTSQITKTKGISKEYDIHKLQSFIKDLSFELTGDQLEAVEDILKDLQSDKTMYRFLQGDVGSGKTIVATIGIYANYLAGFQGAFMAPTEVLAAQLYDSLCHTFKNKGLQVELLVGSHTAKQKEDIYQRLLNGQIDVLVGTHALFQEKVVYQNLGFIVTDEQHRFGVKQRKALKDKGVQVDFLIMSATPIPRTLAISFYGDMDVSTIETMPQGRKEIITKVVASTSMKPILTEIDEYLQKGGQCYVVCPLIDKSEAIECRDVQSIYDGMVSYFKDRYQIGLLHGKIQDSQKNEIMDKFKNNEIRILVSTTVIEVGIDVKNANRIVIYNAERFGLSQLHQLRGRVGRGKEQGYCYLLSTSSQELSKERLSFLETCHNGFEISKYDLSLRGPGDMLGNRQSGLPSFSLGDLSKDMVILELARKDVVDFFERNSQDSRWLLLLEKIRKQLEKNNQYID